MNIQKVIRALHPFGDVLEVGFGEASKEIQTYRPRTHTLITQDPLAIPWANKHGGVAVIADLWQNAIANLGIFDAIYFGGSLNEGDFLIRFQYSDTDLDQFCSSVTEKKYLPRFLADLERNGQITREQKDKIIKKYGLTQAKPSSVKQAGEMIRFLECCMASHVRKGSRFCCQIKSDLEDPIFLNQILVDPFLNVRFDGEILLIEKL